MLQSEQALQDILDEGYQARSEEASALAKEFESVDLEGWDGIDLALSLDPAYDQDCPPLSPVRVLMTQ
jgi:hypothetical protein